jgi:hypothetical protein
MLQYNQLSKEIINIILEYDGRIRYRNGKYINQINKEDKIYNCIKEKIKKDLLLVKSINYNIERSNYYYNYAILNNIPMEYYNWHFNYNISIHIELNKLKSKKIYGIYFKYNNRMKDIRICCFYKDISETWWYKCQEKINNISFFLFGRLLFYRYSLFEDKYFYL